MVSEKEINNLFEKHKSVFDALLDFEKTGRTIVKTRMNFTIDRNVAGKFREYCRKNHLNMSAELEKMMDKRVQ